MIRTSLNGPKLAFGVESRSLDLLTSRKSCQNWHFITILNLLSTKNTNLGICQTKSTNRFLNWNFRLRKNICVKLGLIIKNVCVKDYFTHFMPLISFDTPHQRFSDVFREYRKRPVAWNWLMWQYWGMVKVTDA